MSLKNILTLAFGVGLSAVQADVLGEDEINVSECLECREVRRPIDLSARWDVKNLDVILLPYSSVGWGLEDLPSEAVVNMSSVDGKIVNGVFVQDGNAKALATGLTGRGVFQWYPRGMEKKVYRVQHMKTREENRPDEESLSAYFDFTDCEMVSASQFRAAVLGVTQPVNLQDDERYPWRLVGGDGDGVRSSADGARIELSFGGRGTLHYECAVWSGELAVSENDKMMFALAGPADWSYRALRFEGYGRHRVAFVCVAVDGVASVALRRIRWEEDDGETRVITGTDKHRVDLHEGVRALSRTDEVLPFAYSSTNWIGVAGSSSESKASVSIVRMTGSDPVVTKWTAEDARSFRKLHEKPGEGVVSWKPKKGVWKATFDIITGDTSVYREEAWFDLRQARTPGFLLMLK